ncbi:MAG: transporter substrate-binding domain-containing protein, partial [Opitutaceae bacterium]
MLKPIVFLLTVLLGAATVDAAPERMRLRVGVEANSQPLSFLDTNKQPTGFTPELLRAVAREGNIEFDFVTASWRAIQQEFLEGRIDVLANVAINPDRLGYMDFSISHAYVHGAVYYLPDHAPIARTADFAKMTIGTLKGSV